MKEGKHSPLIMVIAGAVLGLAFLLVEWIMLKFDVFGTGIRLFLIDSAVRTVFGIFAMTIHAVWDIIVRILNAFSGISQISALPRVIDGISTVIQLILMPIAAVLICVYYDRLHRKPKTDIPLHFHKN